MAKMSQVSEETFTQANSPASFDTTPEQKDQTIYEVGFHLIPSLGEDEVKIAVDGVHSMLKRYSAEIMGESFPQRMTLAYRIERSVSSKREKYSEAYFGWIKFKAIPTTVPEISHVLQSTPEVLRFIMVESFPEGVPMPRRAVFISDRLEGATIQKPMVAPEKSGEISEEDLDKSIEALVS